jgi:hypothetical protein
MSNIMICLDDYEEPELDEDYLGEIGVIPHTFERAKVTPHAADHILQALEFDGAEIVKDELNGTSIKITPMLRERYFRHYFDEYKRWAELAAKMDFEDFSTYHGKIKFGDAERWFDRPNDVYIWYAGWYSTLSEFLRQAGNGDTFYIGTVFTLS